MPYYIYHIIGRKVGCTNNLERRKQQYKIDEGSVPEIEILETLDNITAQEAGDIEQEWAYKFGYKLGNHYVQTVSNRKVQGLKSKELKKGFHAFTKEQRSIIGQKVLELKLGFFSIPREEHIEISRRTGKTKGAFAQRGTCFHCGIETNLGMLARWHNDNCKHKEG